MMVISVLIALSGIGIAYLLYVRNPALPKRIAERQKAFYTLVYNKYYIDELYQILFVNSLKRLGTGLWRGFDDFIIDGTVNGIAYFVGWISTVLRKIQTGFVQNYALSMVVGGVVLAVYYIARGIFF